MAYSVELTRDAEKQLDKLTDAARRRIIDALERLGENPRHSGTRKLSGEDGLYRTQAGGLPLIMKTLFQLLLIPFPAVNIFGLITRYSRQRRICSLNRK